MDFPSRTTSAGECAFSSSADLTPAQEHRGARGSRLRSHPLGRSPARRNTARRRTSECPACSNARGSLLASISTSAVAGESPDGLGDGEGVDGEPGTNVPVSFRLRHWDLPWARWLRPQLLHVGAPGHSWADPSQSLLISIHYIPNYTLASI